MSNLHEPIGSIMPIILFFLYILHYNEVPIEVIQMLIFDGKIYVLFLKCSNRLLYTNMAFEHYLVDSNFKSGMLS